VNELTVRAGVLERLGREPDWLLGTDPVKSRPKRRLIVEVEDAWLGLHTQTA